MYCEKCGKKNEDGAVYCIDCGNPLENSHLQSSDESEDTLIDYSRYIGKYFASFGLEHKDLAGLELEVEYMDGKTAKVSLMRTNGKDIDYVFNTLNFVNNKTIVGFGSCGFSPYLKLYKNYQYVDVKYYFYLRNSRIDLEIEYFDNTGSNNDKYCFHKTK